MKKKLPIAIETSFTFESYKWIPKLLKLVPSFLIKKHLYEVAYKYKRGELVELSIINLLSLKNTFTAGYSSEQFDIIENPDELESALEKFSQNWREEGLPIFDPYYNDRINIVSAPGNKLLKISNFLYSIKDQKEIFNPAIADWQEGYFQALSKKEIWKARWINVRYTYRFAATMWQKSPVGDLIEFIRKIAK